MTLKEWRAKGEQLFGPDQLKWRFVCPVCKHVASVQDYKDAKAPEGAVGFSCIGRYTGSLNKAFEGNPGEAGPCNYAGGGLFRLNPVHVDGNYNVFEFAE